MKSSPKLYTKVQALLDGSSSCLTVTLPTSTYPVLKQQDLAPQDVIRAEAHLQGDVLSSYGGFWQTHSKDALFHTIGYRLSQDLTSILFTPLQLNNGLNVESRSLRFVLPSAIRPNCFTVSTLNDSLLVDFITDSLVIALKVPLNSFLKGTKAFTATTFYQWCSYSLPYSFDERSPLFLKSLTPTSSVVALNDGGLLLLTREGELTSFLVVPFSDPSYVKSFTARLFGSRSQGSPPEHVEIDGTTVSSKAIIDAALVGSSLVTLSVDKQLTLWSMDGQKSNTVNLASLLPDDLDPVFITRCLPKSLLQLIGSELAVVLPIGSNYLKFFQVDSLEEVNSIDIELEKELWLFHSYSVVSDNTSTKIWFSWCFGDTTILKNCELTDDDIYWASSVMDTEIEAGLRTEWYHRLEGAETSDQATELALERVLDGFNYTDEILEQAVGLFNKSTETDLSGLSIEEKITKVVLSNIDPDLSSVKRQWLRFDSICGEVVKPYRQLAAISYSTSPVEQDPLLLLMTSSAYSIVKKSSALTSVASGNTQVPGQMLKAFQAEGINFVSMLKLVKLIEVFRNNFGSDAILELEKLLFEQGDTTDVMSKIFQNCVTGNIDRSVIANLLDSLNSIPSCLDCMKSLVKLPTGNTGFRPIKNVAFGALGRSVVAGTVRLESITQRKVLMGLLLIVCTVDISDPMVRIFEQASTAYKCSDFNLKSTELPSQSASITSDSLLVKYVEDSYHGGALINNSTLNLLAIDIFRSLFDESYRYYVVATLLSLKAPVAVVQGLLKYLDNTPISVMLKGLVQLQAGDKNSYETFTTTDIAGYKLSSKEEEALQPIASTYTLLLTDSKAEYYYNLCELFEKKDLDSVALKFAMDALSSKNKAGDDSDDTTILAKIFQLSLKLNEFQLAYETIMKMATRERRHAIKQFVYKLFQTSQLSKILEFQFGSDFDCVDSLIYGLGESSALSGDLKNSLKYYRACYSLRLKEGDYRAAVESLYRFNCIAVEFFKMNQFNDIDLLLDHYLIIFNLLATLQNDDRWLIKPAVRLSNSLSPSMGDKLLTYNDLQKEYAALSDAQHSQPI